MILDFWATWCGPCQRLIPILTEIEDEYASKGVTVIGINQRESRDKVRAFAQKNDYKALTLLDEHGSVARVYSVSAFPTLVIIDKDGNLRETIRGLYPEMKDRLVQEIEPLP